MGILKYKYYLKKPRSEIVKDILYAMFVAGAIVIATTSPYFLVNILKAWKKMRKYPKKKVHDTFYNLRRQGLIEIQKVNHQIYISLTPEGKKKASWLQIDDLKIKKPKKWDKKWRIVVFDIAQLKRFYREAFRGKLKELGFYPLQKSVWVFPYDCQTEIDLLRNFFGLTKKEVKLIIAEKIEDEDQLKKN